MNATVRAVAGPHNCFRTAANATNSIKVGRGTLHTVTIGVAGAGSTLTIYDSTGGATGTMAIITTQVNDPVTLHFDARFELGLTVVTAGAAAADITITYV